MKLSNIQISSTEIGTIEATIPAIGIVVPEYEFIITSPTSAKIEQVYLHSGDPIKSGDSILRLTKENIKINFDKLSHEQEMNKNKISQLKLSLERSLNDLQTQYLIKEMKVKSLESSLEHEQSLFNVGGGTKERVHQAVLDLDISRLELKQLKNQISNQEKTMQADLRNLELQIDILDESIKESARKLSQSELRSPEEGVITWISSLIGSEVAEGAQLAKIANLSSFKIEGRISEAYDSQLRTGGAVIVRINDSELRGTITNIQPNVENGIITFYASLEKRNHPILRSNLKTDIFVVTSIKNGILRVKNGAAFKGQQQQKVFVMQGNQAVRREVITGESNFDFIEIRSGLNSGEKVIVSDMEKYMNQKEIQIKG